jgi:hypothetical protein
MWGLIFNVQMDPIIWQKTVQTITAAADNDWSIKYAR